MTAHAEDIDREFANLNKKNAKHAATVLGKLIARTEAQLEAGELRDPAKTAQNLAVAMGITYEKARLAEDKPTTITGHQDSDLTWEQLLRRAGVVDSTAVELPAERQALNPSMSATGGERRDKTRARTREAQAQ